MAQKEQPPFFIKAKKAVIALPYWLAKHRYNTIEQLPEDKSGNQVINLRLATNANQVPAPWVAGIVVNNSEFYEETLEIIEANKVVEA